MKNIILTLALVTGIASFAATTNVVTNYVDVITGTTSNFVYDVNWFAKPYYYDVAITNIDTKVTE